MNLDYGSLSAALCRCVPSGLDWYRASEIVNTLLAPLGRLGEWLLSFVEFPLLGGVASALYIGLGVVVAVIAAALVVTLMLASNLIAAIGGRGVPVFGHLSAIVSVVSRGLDDGWGGFAAGVLVADVGIAIVALVLASRLRGKAFAAAACVIGFLFINSLFAFGQVLETLQRQGI